MLVIFGVPSQHQDMGDIMLEVAVEPILVESLSVEITLNF